jgi:hypothetical protein
MMDDVKEGDKIKLLEKSEYNRLSDEQSMRIVEMSFKIVYMNKFVIGIEHLQEQF